MDVVLCKVILEKISAFLNINNMALIFHLFPLLSFTASLDHERKTRKIIIESAQRNVMPIYKVNFYT